MIIVCAISKICLHTFVMPLSIKQYGDMAEWTARNSDVGGSLTAYGNHKELDRHDLRNWGVSWVAAAANAASHSMDKSWLILWNLQ
jgi:hypothetical protein